MHKIVCRAVWKTALVIGAVLEFAMFDTLIGGKLDTTAGHFVLDVLIIAAITALVAFPARVIELRRA